MNDICIWIWLLKKKSDISLFSVSLVDRSLAFLNGPFAFMPLGIFCILHISNASLPGGHFTADKIPTFYTIIQKIAPYFPLQPVFWSNYNCLWKIVFVYVLILFSPRRPNNVQVASTKGNFLSKGSNYLADWSGKDWGKEGFWSRPRRREVSVRVWIKALIRHF